MAIASGLGLASAVNAWEAARNREAVLASLPEGYVFPGCNEVRAAGLDSLYRGEPGFSERLDGDGDGIGCEPYRGG